MVKQKYITIILLAFLSFSTYAQDAYPDRAKNYVKQFAAFAIADQKSSGVPAAITLGQGILETEAGASELMAKANNHFGIKCKNEWQGETFLHTDDAKDECFKKYKDAQESYNDHSAHLHRNPRYHPLFGHRITDYKKWAHGLKKCGYATNPKYAYELIKIIEDYDLQQYTMAALDTTSEPKLEEPAPIVTQAVVKTEEKQVIPPPVQTEVPAVVATTETKILATQPTTSFDQIGKIADSAQAIIARDVQANASPYPAEEPINDSGKIVTVNGLKAIYCHKEETLLKYAVMYNIRYPHLLEINDLADEPLPFDMYVYLEKKHAAGLNEKHIVKPRETMLMVAQAEGIQLKKLATLNLLTMYEQPMAGATLQLQTAATEKPPVDTSAIKVYSSGAIGAYEGTMVINLMDTMPPVQENMVPTNNGKPNTEEVGFGMGFEGPKATTNEAPQTVTKAPQKQADSTKKQVAPEITKQSFMREDPPQPQLKKPATEDEYKEGDKHYIVKRGETAFSIAKKYGITVEQLLKWNDIEAQDLKAGQTVIVKQ